MREGHRGCRVLAALIAALHCIISGCSPTATSERIEWTTMGTVAAFQYRHWPTEANTTPKLAADSVRRKFSGVERLLNAHDPQSELSRLAALGDDEILERCDKSVRKCYAAAFRLAKESGGAFDPRWRGRGTLDLGAIAKGFAVDEAVISDERLPSLVDLGGNLKSAGGDWKVGIAGSGETLELTNGMACATSGEYYRGKHIRDGRTGSVVTNDVLSVTVVHPTSAMMADGLSTVLFVLGREEGDRFLSAHCPEARAIWIMKD